MSDCIFLSRLRHDQLTDTIPGSVFLLSRGSFSCPTNLLPWRSSSSGVYKKSHRRALSSENVPGLERLLKAWALVEYPQALMSPSGPQGALDPYEPLLPLLMGPCMGLWRECYLRGALHAQVRQVEVSKNKQVYLDAVCLLAPFMCFCERLINLMMLKAGFLD